MSEATPTYRCPDQPRFPGDTFIGCGQAFKDSGDLGWNGEMVECPHCGMFHNPDAPDAVPSKEDQA